MELTFDRKAESGNIFDIMYHAYILLNENDKGCQASEMLSRVVQCDDYEKALSIIGEYVTLIDVTSKNSL